MKVSNPMYDAGGDPADFALIDEAETIGGGATTGGGQTVDQAFGKYEEIFKRYDADGSGTIEAHELGEVMKELGQQLSPAELSKMIDEIDTDGSGEIDFEEFMQAVTGKMSAIFADMNKRLEEQVFGSEVRSPTPTRCLDQKACAGHGLTADALRRAKLLGGATTMRPM